MRTEDEIRADAVPGVPFSNHTMFEIWTRSNCGRSSGCRFDDAYGTAPEGTWCPLISVAMIGEKTPQEWQPKDGEVGECTAYEETVAHATDDEPADENPDAGYGETWRPIETIKGQEGMF